MTTMLFRWHGVDGGNGVANNFLQEWKQSNVTEPSNKIPGLLANQLWGTPISQNNKNTEALATKPDFTASDIIAQNWWLDDIRIDESGLNLIDWTGKRHRVGNEPKETIGHGHLIESEAALDATVKKYGIKDKENWTIKEADRVFLGDTMSRLKAMKKEYPKADPEILKIMLNTRMQFKPGTFKKEFGQYMASDDTDSIKSNLERIGIANRDLWGKPGVYTRFQGVQGRLDAYKKGKQ